MDQLIEEIERIQNIGFEISHKKEQINSEIGISKERISNNLENHQRFQADIQQLEKRKVELEEEKTQKLERKNDMLLHKEKYEIELKQKEEQLEKLSRTLSKQALEMEEKKKLLQENIDQKYEILNEKTAYKANFENIIKQENSLKNQIQNTISDLDGSRSKKEDLAKAFYEIEKRKNDLSKTLENMQLAKHENMEKLKEFDTKINAYQSEYRIKEAKYKFLVETEKEKEGYSKSVKTLMNSIERNENLKKGVHGVLANLISVDEKYQTAIEIALGASLQNIVTDTEQEAKKLVNYLKENKIGRASFLPISSVKGQKLRQINLKGITGFIAIASDLVKLDSKYEGIILNLLGRTVVVEDMDSAIALAKKNQYGFKIVTVTGDIINPSGMISGGSILQKTVSILGREREIHKLQQELKILDQKIRQIQTQKENYQMQIQDVLDLFEEKQTKFQETEIFYATEKQKIEQIELEVLKFDTKLAKLREDLEKIKQEKQENLAKQEQFEIQMNKIEEENQKLNEVINEFTSKNKENQTEMDDLNFSITNLKISVSSFDEGEASMNEIMERIEQEKQNHEQSIQTKNQLMNQLLSENEQLQQKIENLQKSIQDFEKEVKNSSEKVENLKKERILKNEKLDKLEEQIKEQNEKIEDVKNQISKLEIKKSKIDLEQNQMINKMWEEYELTPNHAGEVPTIENPNEVQRQVSHLRSQIRELGSVDLDSIQRYQEIKERYDFLSEQRYDLEEAMAKLKKVIQDMTDTMKKQFTEQFEKINQNFGEVFKELFGGGKAELILADEVNVLECGIEIQVQPPGKKLQNMNLLSGGERAFTAIALLFAILKINPAPFCVLDEIEAALDDVNVFRFAQYLKKFCQDTQFLVITHRKGTMEVANTVYGITMEEKGISKLLSMKLR